MKKEKEIIKNFFDGLKFIIYNDYQDLEPALQEDYGEIGSYVMNIIIGFFEYLNRHPDLVDYLKTNYSELFEKF